MDGQPSGNWLQACPDQLSREHLERRRRYVGALANEMIAFNVSRFNDLQYLALRNEWH